MIYGASGLGFAGANLILARVLPTPEYAVFTLVIAIVNLSFALAPIGVDGIVQRRHLDAGPILLKRTLAAGIVTAIASVAVAALAYHLNGFLLVLVFAATVGGGAMAVAGAQFQSEQRYAISLALTQSPNLVLIVAALAVILTGTHEARLPLIISSVGFVLSGVVGWWILFRERASKPHHGTWFPWGEALSFAGLNAAGLLLVQLDRLIIPHVLPLHDLATFGVLAAIVGSLFRVLSMGVGYTLVPRLRAAASIVERRRLIAHEAKLVSGIIVAGSLAIWFLTPLIEHVFLAGKYHLGGALVLGDHFQRDRQDHEFVHQGDGYRAGHGNRSVDREPVGLGLGGCGGCRRRFRGPVGARGRHLWCGRRVAGAGAYRLISHPPPSQVARHHSGNGTMSETGSSSSGAEWAVGLFNRSVLKQAKFRQILARLDDLTGKRALDIGADNGVISYLLRQRGGHWHSADLDETAVSSIRQLVQTDVHQLDGGPTPFETGAFDLVVIVDFLEHIPDDRGFARELARVIKPGGQLVVNVPQDRPGSLVTRLRHKIGLTDEWHGHLRPGYSVEGLTALLGPSFRIEEAVSYSRAFSELIDTGLNGLYLKMQRRQGVSGSTAKGPVVTGRDLRKHRKEFLLLSALYPLIWTVAKLDHLLWFTPGYKLIVSARRAPVPAPRPAVI